MSKALFLTVGKSNALHDVHIIAGSTVTLLDRLHVHEMTLDDRGAEIAHDIFRANDRSTWSDFARDKIRGIEFGLVFSPLGLDLHGMELQDKDVGRFRTRAGVNGIRNIIVDVIVITGPPRPDGRIPATRHPMRVHVHDRIAQVVLTPNPMSVAPRARVRFSVLATFGDRTVGDISLDPGLRWEVLSGPFEVLNEADPPVVDANGQWLRAKTDDTGSGRVKLTLPPELRGGAPDLSLEAGVRTRPGWDVAREVIFLKEFSAGLHRLNDVPNVLFIADGFLKRPAMVRATGDLGEFETAVREIVQSLRSNPLYSPYDLLIRSQSLNFFMLPMASDEIGGNVLPAIVRESVFTEQNLAPLIHPVRPPDGDPTRVRSVENLVFQVGLPVPDDRTRKFVEQKVEWDRLYTAAHTQGVTENMHGVWLGLVTLNLAQEVDTAIGIAHGFRPQVGRSDDGRSMRWHPFRAQRRDLDRLLEKLTVRKNDGTSMTIGSVWTTGFDRDRVYILCHSPRFGGTRIVDEGTFSSFSEAANCQADPRTPGGAVKLVVPPMSSPVPSLVVGTVAHELGHTLLLGDEYGNIGALTLPETSSRTEMFFNIQSDGSVRPIGGGPVLSGRIRWGWPRIEAAAVLDKKPNARVDAPDEIILVIRPRQGTDFLRLAKDTLIRLRRRPLMELDVNRLITPPPSPFLKVKQQSADGAEIIAIKNPGDTLRFDDFLTGSLLFVTRATPAGTALDLVDDRVETQISDSQSPLNRRPPAACRPMEGAQIPVNLPAGLNRGPKSVQIIGLYDGGAGFHCGVYHATGECMMRATKPDEEAPRVTTVVAGDIMVSPARMKNAPFCFVCRYILVDLLNPNLHAQINTGYPELP